MLDIPLLDFILHTTRLRYTSTTLQHTTPEMVAMDSLFPLSMSAISRIIYGRDDYQKIYPVRQALHFLWLFAHLPSITYPAVSDHATLR